MKTSLRKIKFRKTKEGVIRRIWDGQLSTSKRRGHPMPSYTIDELKDWCFSQKIFHELYDRWKSLDYLTLLKPSCDRKDSNKSYTLSNLQLVTVHQNIKNGAIERKTGKDKRNMKPVIQMTEDNVKINEFHSQREAMRQTGCYHIHDVCLGKRSQSGGYFWKYKE